MKDLRGFLKPKEIEAIEYYLPKPKYKLLFRILKMTGRRITEIIGRKEYKHGDKTYPQVTGLRPMDIDWEDQSIVFNILKKKSPHKKRKPVDAETLNMIRSYINTNGIEVDQPIFKLSRVQAYRVFRTAAENARIYYVGEKPFHPHHLRHSFAVNVLKTSTSPMDLRRVQMMLEHSDLRITEHYLQFGQEEERKLVENLYKKEE